MPVQRARPGVLLTKSTVIMSASAMMNSAIERDQKTRSPGNSSNVVDGWMGERFVNHC